MLTFLSSQVLNAWLFGCLNLCLPFQISPILLFVHYLNYQYLLTIVQIDFQFHLLCNLYLGMTCCGLIYNVSYVIINMNIIFIICAFLVQYIFPKIHATFECAFGFCVVLATVLSIFRTHFTNEIYGLQFSKERWNIFLHGYSAVKCTPRVVFFQRIYTNVLVNRVRLGSKSFLV